MPPPCAAPCGAQGQVTRGRGRDPVRAWLTARARLEPRLLIRASPAARAAFGHAWAPMAALDREIRQLPPDLWVYLLGCAGGFAVVCTGESRYVPGVVAVRHQDLHNVAFVSVEDLASNNDRPLHVIGHLVDHYLGCDGKPGGLWLSEGGGVVPHWQEQGARLSRLFALGYGLDKIAQASVRDYLAQSLAYYCRDRKRLNVADPQVTKWFRTTLWNDTFWRSREF